MNEHIEKLSKRNDVHSLRKMSITQIMTLVINKDHILNFKVSCTIYYGQRPAEIRKFRAKLKLSGPEGPFHILNVTM